MWWQWVNSVISVIVATKLDPTEPRDPTRYPSFNDFLTTLAILNNNTNPLQ